MERKQEQQQELRNVNNKKVIINGDKESLPVEDEILKAYNQINILLSKKTQDSREFGFVVLCTVIAAFASYYNYSFGKEYMHDVSKRWGFSEEEATVFGTICGIVGLIINTAINGKSVHQAFYVVKDEIIKKNLRDKTPMPDDNLIRISLGVMCLLSVIGALPNLKFIYDTIKDDGLAYLIFMEVVQFIVMSALNLRGLYNTLKVNTEKKTVARIFKLEMLTEINECLVENKLNAEDLRSLSEGVSVRNSSSLLQKIIRITSIGTVLYVGPYSAVQYFVVKKGLEVSNEKSFWADMANFGVTDAGLLASALKWFLLGNGYANLVMRNFNLYRDPILKSNGKEVRLQSISRNTERTLVIVGLVVALFSLGSSSKIVEKYFYDGTDKSSETFWTSLLIGGGAAWGINTNDLSNIMEKIIDLGGYLLNTKIRKKTDPLEHLGNSNNENIMRNMLTISTMPENTFLDKFTEEFNSQNQDDAYKKLKPHVHAEHKTAQVYMHGRVTNSLYDSFIDGCRYLKNVASDTLFNSFKTKTYDEIDEDEVNAFLEQKRLFQA